MHRPAWLRLLIAVWALWFTTAVVEPAGLFACAMHGTVAPAASATASEQASHRATAEMHAQHSVGSRHTMVATDAVQASATDTHSQQQHDCCTCLGHCCQSIPVGAPTTVVTLALILERDAALSAIAITTRAVTRRPYDQPFANGPPALTT